MSGNSRRGSKRKANAEYLSRQVWNELNIPSECRDFFYPGVFSLPDKILKHSKVVKPNSKTRDAELKKKINSYTAMRKEREEFRKKLIELIIGDEEPVKDDTFPSSSEKEVLRYYYYIKHGIDTIHVAPMDAVILKKVVSLIPKHLLKWKTELEELTTEIKSEYLVSVKKAIVDFVLGDSLQQNSKKEELTPVRIEAKGMTLKWKHRYNENRLLIKRNLFSINICLAQVLAIWYTEFKSLSFVNIERLSEKTEAYDLSEFTSVLNRQIEETKIILNEKWCGQIQGIFARGTKRKVIPDVSKTRLLRRFFDSVAALMTQQLQDLCIRSLNNYTKFMCDVGKSNPGFRLTILLESEDTLTFSPNFAKFHSELLKMIDLIVKAVQLFPRIETKVYLDHQGTNIFLKPAIPNDFIEECRYKIYQLLEEQRIGPELRMQDFDKYMSLMNGLDSENIDKFIARKPTFQEYCDLAKHYRNLEHEIPAAVWGVVNMGFYEFHREGLIDTLEGLAKFMQNELITKMTKDQQADIAKLGAEYEMIAAKALSMPKDTSELMSLKAYVALTEDKTISEMEEKLKMNLNHLLYLTSITIFSPLEIKQNSSTFQW